MADISKINVNSIDYNLKDTEARSGIVDTKTISNTSIASFNDGAKAPVKSLTTLITPIQAGTGTPSPTNIRSISGHSTCVITRTGANILSSDTYQASANSLIIGGTDTSYPYSLIANTSYTLVIDVSKTCFPTYKETNSTAITLSISTVGRNVYQFTPTVSGNYSFNLYNSNGFSASDVSSFAVYKTSEFLDITIPLGSTVYGGSLECVEGEGQIAYGYVEFDGSSDENWEFYNNTVFRIPFTNAAGNQGLISNWLPTSSGSTFGIRATTAHILCYQILSNIPSITDLTSWKTYLSNNPLQVVYRLATPASISIMGTNIETLSGLNNIYSSSGDIETLEYFTQSSDKTEELIRTTSYTKDETNNLLDITTEITASAPIQSFSDGGNNIPLKSCLCNIPIDVDGISSVTVSLAGKNLCPIISSQTVNGVQMVASSDGTLTFNRVSSSTTVADFEIPVLLPSGEYTISANNNMSFSGDTLGNMFFRPYDANGTSISAVSFSVVNKTYTFTNSVSKIVIRIARQFSESNFTLKMQLEKGDTSTTYETYKRHDTTISLGETLTQGGTLEAVSGLLTRTDETTSQLTGVNIDTLSGLNNVYSDCGDIKSVEYFNNKADDIANMIRLMTRT